MTNPTKGAPLIEQIWYSLGQPWCHSDDAGFAVLAGNEDPHVARFLFDTQPIIEEGDVTQEQADIEAREVVDHIVELHNASLTAKRTIPADEVAALAREIRCQFNLSPTINCNENTGLCINCGTKAALLALAEPEKG